MNHNATKLFTDGRRMGPDVGFKVAGVGDNGGATGGAPIINAAEGSTVVYAAPGATIGHLAGIKPGLIHRSAEGTSNGWLSISLGDFLEKTAPLWALTTITLGLVLIFRGRSS